MLETSLIQLEQLVSDLVQKNQDMTDRNDQISAELAQAKAELAQAKDENESLQLTLMEQEEKQGATAARIQALVERASVGSANA